MVLTRSGAKFRLRQRIANRRSEFYRAGRDIFALNALMPDMAAPFPPLQERQLLQHGFMPPRNANIYQPLDMRVRQAASIRDLGNDATARKMRVRINRIARRTIRAGVRFRRMLSYGGMGVTCLFEVKNAQGLYNKCVVKMARPDCEPELLSEKKIMQTLKGAAHVVQIKTARELRGLPDGYGSEAVNGVMPQDPPDRPRVADMNSVDRDPSILMMEYLRRGTLGYWIELLDQHMTDMPADVLWHMLACLVDGCVAMTYPPRYQEQNAHIEDDMMTEYIPTEVELRRNKRSLKKCNYVHFDLDPSNILVDDFDEVDHASVPRLKIADFGATTKADASFYKNTRKLWGERFSGKVGYLMPEQWTAEWDLVEGNPLRDEPEICGVAGAYSEKSNIWQIGMIMLNLITQMGPENPPYARRVPLPRQGDDDVLLRGYQANNRFIMSHGYMLDDPSFDNTMERQLRNVVMACLAYAPESRPTLLDLVEICETRISAGFPDANRQWGSILFANTNVPEERDPRDAYNDDDGAVPEDEDRIDFGVVDEEEEEGNGNDHDTLDDSYISEDSFYTGDDSDGDDGGYGGDGGEAPAA